MNAMTRSNAYNFGFLDEYAKKEVRRAILKAIAIPGYQVPYASREMPMGRGFGTGGLQLTLSLIGPDEVVKVIDQGSDDSVNAVNLRQFIELTCPGVSTTTKTIDATLIQSRHRIPELPLTARQIIVLQVPYPDPLVVVEPSEDRRKTMHGEADYSRLLVKLYEDIVKFDEITIRTAIPRASTATTSSIPRPFPAGTCPSSMIPPPWCYSARGARRRSTPCRRTRTPNRWRSPMWLSASKTSATSRAGAAPALAAVARRPSWTNSWAMPATKPGNAPTATGATGSCSSR